MSDKKTTLTDLDDVQAFRERLKENQEALKEIEKMLDEDPQPQKKISAALNAVSASVARFGYPQ